VKLTLRLLALLILLLSCSRDGPPPNVLLIGVDTLRPDHLGSYGYGRSTSPHIDGLADEGILFERAVSQCPWTLPSFASIMTSLYPSQHGAGLNMGDLGTGFPTMAEILADQGYATGAVVSSRVLSPEFGLNRGFAYYDVNRADEERRAPEVTSIALSWLDGVDGQPFFLFVHYFDPHLPYAPPAPYDGIFETATGSLFGSEFDLRPLLEDAATLRELLEAFTGPDWERIVSLYDGEIAYTDEAIGGLLQGLDERGLMENTLVILLGDHGEEFYEHGGLGHGHTLFDEVIRVPLVISPPGGLPGGMRIKSQVRMVDVLPTILDLLGFEFVYAPEGVSLLGLMESGLRERARHGSLFPSEVAYSEGLRRGTERKSLCAYPWKLIYDTETDRDMVFSLEADPGEVSPVAGDPPESIEQLKNTLIRNLMTLKDTWYIDMVPGPAPSDFKFRISVEHDLWRGRFTLCRYIAAGGDIVRPSDLTRDLSRLEADKTGLHEPLTLAFQVDAPPGLPVSFDLSIDGVPATRATYFGNTSLTPDGMPFALHGMRRALRSEGGPSLDRSPPYFVIRRSEAKRAGRPAKIGEETRGALRALGYIQ
jgi:arylsulfatase A-like enzyme